MLDAAGGGDHDVGGQVALAWKPQQLLARRGADDLGAPERRAPERMVGEDRLAEDVEDQILRIVLVHRDLLEHDSRSSASSCIAGSQTICAITSKARSRCWSSTRA